MTRYLIDDEPVGWSSINDSDWSLPPGWATGGPKSYRDREGEQPQAPMVCSCPLPGGDCDPLDIEWAYMLTAPGLVVYARAREAGRYLHRLVATVPWEGSEPDWESLEEPR